MKKAWLYAVAASGVLVVFLACGSSSDGTTSAQACTPGQSAACTGPGGCSGGQVCSPSGTFYGDCVCGGSDAGNASDSGNAGDAATGPDGSTDAGRFDSPLSLPGLRLWVNGQDFGDAGTEAGSPVKVWPDQSGKGNDLSSVGSTKFSLPTVDPSSVGGQTSLSFALSGQEGERRTTPAAFVDGTANFVAEVVVLPGMCISPTTCTLVELEGTTTALLRVENGTLYGIVGTSDQGTASVSDGAHVIALRRTSLSEMEIRVDGTPTTFALTSAPTLGPTQGFDFGRDQVSAGYDGQVAEIVVVSDPSDADVANLEAYLKSKYGL